MRSHVLMFISFQKRNTLLVCCIDGQVLEIEGPESGKFDTSHTFQIEGLIKRSHQFKSVKSVLRVNWDLNLAYVSFRSFSADLIW